MFVTKDDLIIKIKTGRKMKKYNPTSVYQFYRENNCLRKITLLFCVRDKIPISLHSIFNYNEQISTD